MRDLFAQFVTKAGIVERPVALEGWFKPERVEISGGYLVYDFGKQPKPVRPKQGMMAGFLKLENAPDEQIAAYARQWGALAKSPTDYASGDVVAPDGLPFFDSLHGRREAIEDWRVWSREVFGLLLRVAEFNRLLAEQRPGSSGNEKARIAELAGDIQGELNSLYLSANMVCPCICWGNQRWSIRLRCATLRAAISVQLMLMIAQKDGLALCRDCGAPFEIEGKRNTYCAGCGSAAARRAASKRHYQKKRTARDMHKRGRTAAEIAAVMGQPTSRINRWLR